VIKNWKKPGDGSMQNSTPWLKFAGVSHTDIQGLGEQGLKKIHFSWGRTKNRKKNLNGTLECLIQYFLSNPAEMAGHLGAGFSS